MSEHDKSRSNNEKVTSQRRIVIASQEMRNHDEDSRKKENKEDTKKSIEQILQEITNVSTAQRNLIMSLCKLESEDIILHAMSSEVWANLKRFQT